MKSNDHMKTIFHYWEKWRELLVALVWVLAMLFNIAAPSVIYLAGLLGLFYCSYYLYVLIFRPIKRDWLMVYGRFLAIVLNITMLLPFALFLLYDLIGEVYLFGYSGHGMEGGFWSFWYHYIDQGNQVNLPSWTTLFSVCGIFLLNGLLISTLTSWIDRRKEVWNKGEIRYPVRALGNKAHYVVIGGGDVAIGVVKQLAQRKDNAYIFILTSSDVEAFRRELYSSISADESFRKRIIIYCGSLTSRDEIKALYIERAKEVYIIGENLHLDDIESYHDVQNIKCLRLIADQRGDQKEKLPCRVMFEYQTTFSVFQFSEISNSIRNSVVFKPFNFYEMWAQKVLVGWDQKSRYIPLEGWDGIHADSNEYVHLIIVGMSRMGTALAKEAAHLAHYPNNVSAGVRTKITFIDKNASEGGRFFRGRFRELFSLSRWSEGVLKDGAISYDRHLPENSEHLGGDFLDVEWEFIEGSVEENHIQEYLESAVKATSKATVAYCLTDSNKCLAAALYSDRAVFENALQVLVYNRYGDALVEELRHGDSNLNNPYSNKLRVFGMADEGYSEELIIKLERMAARNGIEYDVIRQGLLEKELLRDEGSGLDKSAVAKWWSNIYNAQMLWTKLRCVSAIDPASMDIIAKVEHNRWNMEQLLMGFRPLTEVEQQSVIADFTQKNVFKGNMAHFDICSNARLKEIDPVTIQYDEGFSSLLPELKTLSEKL